MANKWGNIGNSDLGSKITANGDCSHEIKRCLLLGRKAMTNLHSVLKKQRYYFSQQRLIWMWDMDHKEAWAPKNWCFRTVVLEDSWESLKQQEIKPVNLIGNQPWIFIGKSDAEAEDLILWPPDVKSWLVGKTLMLGKIECRRRRGQQRMRWLDGITDSMDKFEQTAGDGEGQGSLVCCSPCGHKESDMTEGVNWTDTNLRMSLLISRSKLQEFVRVSLSL